VHPATNWQYDFGGSIDLSAKNAVNNTLQVRASIDDVTWSETVEMTIIVVPPLMERWWALALMVTLGTLLVFAVLRYWSNRRYRSRVGQLREREQLAMIRQRMAMDLHDDLGAELSSILLLTRIEREHPEPGSLERVEQLIGTLTEKVKEVIWSTDPGSDTLEATLAFIQRYVIKVCERHGLRVRTTIPTMLPRFELAAGRRRELFLIAKEAVNNTVKHAGASAFTLIVTVDGRAVTLELADDGIGGASSAKEHSGQGIRNMSKRASDLGATLEFQEVRPHGTRITLRLSIE
jgi:signal transduction histidine kinase